MFKISPAKKDLGVYCCAYACRNEPIKKKGGLCHKHYARKLREQDPVLVRWMQAKGKAKQRNKPWSITLDQFRDFCNQTGYLVKKGRRGQNSTIDRIDNNKGYTIDNIQLLTNRQNASKGDKDINDVMNDYNNNKEIPF